jgi:hypothetical protein
MSKRDVGRGGLQVGQTRSAVIGAVVATLCAIAAVARHARVADETMLAAAAAEVLDSLLWSGSRNG